MHKGIRSAIAGLACLAAVAALGACSDDDDGEEAGAGDADGNGEVTTVEGDLGELCDLKLQIDAADFQSPTYLEDVTALVGQANEAAPPELEEAFRTISDAYGNAAEDEAALESPEFIAASAEVAEATHTGCGWEQVDITNVEYAFEGVPDEVPAGVTSFLTTNEGEEPHVAVLMKVPDDLEDPASVLESPEPPAGTEVIGAAFGAPGDMAGFAADLEAGTYFMFCDIPVGGAEDGAPHFAEGMQRVFTVT